MTPRILISLWALSLLLVPSTVRSGAMADDAVPAAKEDDLSAELPRIPSVAPEQAVATFVTVAGYQVEQVAAEPLVTDPIAIAFDEQGRLFVVEMHDYSEDADGHTGLVRMLTDTDGDGRFDTSSVYVDHLSWPTAVLCYDGGIFVGAAPDIWYCKDTSDDGHADTIKKVFTGFGRGNVQGLLNSFAWGLDNRIHGATSGAGGAVRRADDDKAKPLNLSGRDFSFDPRTFELVATSGGGQYGMSFDQWGRKFVCSNSDHIQQVMFDDRYLARNPYLAAPSPRVSIAPDGPQAEIYRASPVEPWRVVRTRLRVAGRVPGPIEGGGRASGYFTGATGITIYRGNAWPAEDQGMALIGDACTNLLHRKRLEPHGLEMIARRIDEMSEFVASRDIWFRPVQCANAPDGGLYIADMYREVIEHPLSLPPIIKKHLDLTSGRDRGRIYRVVPVDFRQPPLPKLGKATTAELVAALAHPNGWQREAAARLLYERQDKAAVPELETLAARSPSAVGRMYALHALEGLQALSPQVLLATLGDKDPRVREHAVRLAEKQVNASAELRAMLLRMAANENELGVRYQLLFSLGELDTPDRDIALAGLARGIDGDRWLRLALLSSLGGGVERVFRDLFQDQAFRATDDGQSLLAALAEQAGAQARPADVALVVASINGLDEKEAPLARSLVRGLAEGASRQGGSLERFLAASGSGHARDVLNQLLRDADATARDEKRPAAERARSTSLVALGPTAGALELIETLVGHRQPQEVQLAALTALGRVNDVRGATIILEAWPGLSPRLRSQAAESLFARADRLQLLLGAIEDGRFRAEDLDPARIQQLRAHPDPRVRQRASSILSAATLGRRPDVVAAYRPALELVGDRERGKQHFQKVCAACHRVEGVGHDIGSSLAAMKNRGPEAILVNMLDPNREVNPQFVNYALVTTDGRTLTGMIDAETATSVTLKRAEAATDTVLRVNIDQLAASGQSLMPEGVEQQLGVDESARAQAIADLIAYLMSVP